MAQIFGQTFAQHFAFDRRENARFLGTPEAAGIDGDENIGWREFAFALDAFDQRVRIGFDPVHLDPRFSGEFVIERKVGVVMARGVDVHLAIVRHRSHSLFAARTGRKRKCQSAAENQFLHGLPFILCCE